MRFSLLISTLALAACGTTPDTPVEFAAPAAVSAEDVTEGFRTAVIDVCLTSLESGTPIAGMASETGPIEQVSTGRETVWAPKRGKGAVSIRASSGSCWVQASGAPAEPALERVTQALLDPHSFRPVAGAAKARSFSKKAGERTISVSLDGKPGASTMSATVSIS